ncbi:DUF4166 domain-containing protein [Zavarzinia sp. CC-PAN008]|uniref:SDR family oxidoreductase n=1 Tax=Zavarzinia sp. CC-PAN008 TaxID=3243332 RepID=UPI003F74565C
MTRILVAGASGAFGRNLVEGLLATTDCTILAIARDHVRLAQETEALRRRFGNERLALLVRKVGEIRTDFLRAEGIAIVVDAAGPFQQSDLHLARAAIAAGCHYLDLADSRAFVAGFDILDSAAREAGVVARTGASTTPALSQAVLDHLTAGWPVIETVEIAVSPGNRAPRGLSVVRAILSYTGLPIRVLDQGAWTTRPGWSAPHRRRIGNLGRRWLALVETPDLDLAPKRLGVRRTALFRAGLELGVLHLGLWLASWIVRAGVVTTLEPMARGFRVLAQGTYRLGTDRGGMMVEARGQDAAGMPVGARWTLVAEAGDGPHVPTLATLAAIRAILSGQGPAPGAAACAGWPSLDQIAAEMARHRITTQVEAIAAGSVLSQVLGADFPRLPPPLRAFHGRTGQHAWEGRATVEGGNFLGQSIARLMRLPFEGADVPVRVDVEAGERAERWTRRFPGRRFATILRPVPDQPGRIAEQMGPVTATMAATVEAAGLVLRHQGWRLLGIPLPRALGPRIAGREGVDASGRFTFDVTISAPIVGRIVHYRGWLRPVGGDEPLAQS